MWTSILSLLYLPWALGSQLVCDQPVDILFLQDTTQSFEKLIEIITREIADIAESILEVIPDVNFAMAEFKDKPFKELGFPGYDWCYDLKSSMSGDIESLVEAYGNLYGSSGNDIPEAHYTALYYSMYDQRVAWRPDSKKIVVYITDAQPHLAGDPLKYGLEFKDFIPSEFTFNPDNFEELCNEYDYPGYEEFRQLILDKSLFMIFAVANGPDVPLGDVAAAAWQWVESNLTNAHSIYREIDQSFEDLSSSVISALHDFIVNRCHDVTTTEEPTTTRRPTTTQLITTPREYPPTTDAITAEVPPTTNEGQPPTEIPQVSTEEGGCDGGCHCCHCCDHCDGCHHCDGTHHCRHAHRKHHAARAHHEEHRAIKAPELRFSADMEQIVIDQAESGPRRFRAVRRQAM